MKKIITFSICMLLAATTIAQNNNEGKIKPVNTPAIGAWSIGVSFNMLGLGKAVSQPKDGEGASSFITSTSTMAERQMFVIAQNPLALIQFKHRKSEHWAHRIGIGFSGSNINYREYVFDDLARKSNPNSEERVTDCVTSNMNTVSLNLGMEYSTGANNVKLILGAGLTYVVGGGSLSFKYGNAMTALNPKPTTSGKLLESKPGEVGLNDFIKGTQGIEAARPTKRYSVGYTHGLGISMDIGMEYYFVKNASLQASINFIPVMGTFQPQTYSTFEGFSTKSGRVESYNDLISPGSWGVLYGTQNIGVCLGLNYYF